MTTINLVTGVSGQDGFFISRHLLKKGHRVLGVSRRQVDSPHVLLLAKYPKYQHYAISKYTKSNIEALFREVQPDRVFHAAGFRDIPSTDEEVAQCFFTNVELLAIIIAAIRQNSPKTRLLFISSAEIYGKNAGIAHEKTAFNPENPYAVSKIEGMQQIEFFRSNGGFGSVAICFNHDSFLSPTTHLAISVVRKLLKSRESSTFFNTSIHRDFGHASDFSVAFDLILSHHTPDNFVVCTGTHVSLDDYINMTCHYLKIEPAAITRSVQPDLETYARRGDSQKIRSLLGWTPRFTVEKICKNIIYWEKKNQNDRINLYSPNIK
jgi:GDPmannose 4,6-dehydratase